MQRAASMLFIISVISFYLLTRISHQLSAMARDKAEMTGQEACPTKAGCEMAPKRRPECRRCRLEACSIGGQGIFAGGEGFGGV
jgi:hypothetical protein